MEKEYFVATTQQEFEKLVRDQRRIQLINLNMLSSPNNHSVNRARGKLRLKMSEKLQQEWFVANSN